jgi:hypothetical protein
MHRFSTVPLLFGLLASPATFAAAPVLPGLWEMTSSNVQMNGQSMPGVERMLQVLQSLPPDQRQAMEKALEKQGVAMGSSGMRLCLTQAQIDAERFPMQDRDSQCTQQITSRTANAWTFAFQCPNAKGTGVINFVSPRETRTSVKGSFTDPQGRPASGSMDYHGQWLGADCGALGQAQ